MKTNLKNSALGLTILILGGAIIVAGILVMALYHDMIWQSYVVIGAIMIAALWAMFNLPLSLSERREKVPVRHNRR